MKIRLTTICYNEEKILPYFLSHYSKFVDQIIIYDNESTDGTLDILNNTCTDKVKVITNKTNNEISDLRYLEIKNNSWKENREEYDWQIIVDIDEFIYHKDLQYMFEMYKHNKITIIPTIGFNMISNKFPTDYSKNLIDLCKNGIHDFNYGKPCIFNPNEIKDINYAPGAHMCSPVGNIKIGNPSIKLLHYKYFGYDYWKYKNDMYVSRITSNTDGYANAYLIADEKIKREDDYVNHFNLHNEINVIDSF